MKRIIALILSVSLLLTLSGCGNTAHQMPVNFYYQTIDPVYNSPDGIIAPEARDFYHLRNDMDAFLEVYLAGPLTKELQSPFPRDTHVLNWEQQDGILKLNMSESFAALSGVELTVACGCIVRTMCENLPIESVEISVEGATLNGKDSIVLSADSLTLFDDSLDRMKTTLNVYYSDSDRRYLISQSVSLNAVDESEIIHQLIEKLKTPPANSGLLSPLPRGTRLLDVSIDDGLCILDLSAEFETDGWSQTEAQRLTLLSLVNTLTQIEGINSVEFWVEGHLLVQYRSLTINGPMVWDDSVIGPVRTGLNEFDATLYLANGSSLYLVAVPTRIKQTAGISQYELVLDTLLNYQGLNGFNTTIPEGVTVNSLVMDRSVCYVDLSSEFLTTTDHLLLSTHSIIASLCALDEIGSVRITVDGKIPSGTDLSYFAILRPSADWFG